MRHKLRVCHCCGGRGRIETRVWTSGCNRCAGTGRVGFPMGQTVSGAAPTGAAFRQAGSSRQAPILSREGGRDDI